MQENSSEPTHIVVSHLVLGGRDEQASVVVEAQVLHQAAEAVDRDLQSGAEQRQQWTMRGGQQLR